MDVAEGWVAQWDDFASCIELHRTRPEGDHRVGEGDILALQSLDVAHHLGLGVVLVEDLIGEEGRGTDELPVDVDRVLAYFVVEVAFLTQCRCEDVAEYADIFGQSRLVDT